MASIKGMLPSDVLVLRDGGQTKISAKELVPGDLVSIGMGEKVPADLKLIEASADLQFDRSILTGEACFSFHHTLPPSIDIFNYLPQSEAVFGRVVMTDENFLEVGHLSKDIVDKADVYSPDEKRGSPRHSLRQWFRSWPCHSNWR